VRQEVVEGHPELRDSHDQASQELHEQRQGVDRHAEDESEELTQQFTDRTQLLPEDPELLDERLEGGEELLQCIPQTADRVTEELAVLPRQGNDTDDDAEDAAELREDRQQS